MTYRSAGLAAGVVCLLAGPSPALAAPATVTVRVEGAASTLVAATPVTTTTVPVLKQGNSCAGTSAGGALEQAAGRDWGGAYFPGLGQTVEQIKGETHTFAGGSFWSFWVNHVPAASGICTTELQSGDEVLLFPDCASAGCTSLKPLILSAPATARRGKPVTVKVEEVTGGYDPIANQSTAARDPSPGVAISGVGPQMLTGADGTAAVTPDRGGVLTLSATKTGSVRDAARLCVSEGDDGTCGTTAPGSSVLGATRDNSAPAARLAGIREQQRFTRAGAPRVLRGSVPADPSGLATVKLRLTRRDRGRCAYLSGRKERFVRTRCGRSFYFAIGTRAEFSYLLPERLSRGRYVLDVIAVDRAGNRDKLARGRNRMVFTVR